ncbi:MAG: hypothetical protein M0Z49_09015 [Chloroflexi bacterium]|nr:hypothetical protein [Chloroflexota bacterium]
MADSHPIPSDPRAWRPQTARPSRRPRPVVDPIIEPHWGGLRVIAHVARGTSSDEAGRCVLLDDLGEDVTHEEPEVVEAILAALGAEDAVLDGYLTDQATRPGTQVSMLPVARRSGNIVMGHRMDADIAPPLEDDAPRPVAFVAVDVLRVDGQDLLEIPLLERKRLLDSLLEVGELVRVSPYTRPPVEAWLRSWRAAGFDGVVLKAANSRYRPGSETVEWTISFANPERR